MSAPPRVAAIVPVRCESPFLAGALASALSQDPPPNEVIVVDDASPTPLELPAEHAERCTLVRREHQGGPAAARATGLAATEAELVALLDSDDVWRPGKLEVQLQVLAEHPEVAVCFGRAVVIGTDGRPTRHTIPEVSPGLVGPSEMARTLYERNPIPTSSAVIRRGPLEEAGGLEGAATDDWGCWARLAERGERFWFEARDLVEYRRHPRGRSADLALTARQALAVQDAHPELAPPGDRGRVRRDYLTLMARGHIRQRRYGEAREALRQAARAAPLGTRERALALAAAVPGIRAALGRRDPYGKQ